jgi:hypothetical protein
MSAFYVGNDAISRLANSLEKDGEWLNNKAWGKLPRDTKQLADMLYAMNCASLEERYGKHSDMTVPFEYTEGLEYESDSQFYKSLSCYIYQCSEGKVVDTESFKTVERLSDALAHKIAYDFANAKGARWE